MPENLRDDSHPPSNRPSAVLLLIIIATVVTAAALRPGATSVGPVLPEIVQGLHISGAAAGLLTALPGVSFAVFGLVSASLARRLGFVSSLIFAATLSFVGLALRVVTGSGTVFLLLSVMALAGMAIGNVILPALIKAEFRRRSTQVATAYTTFLAVGSTLPNLLSPLLLRQGSNWLGVEQGWRVPIGTWALLSLASLVLWIVVYGKAPWSRGPETKLRGRESVMPSSRVSIWRSRTAVSLMFFFGMQSMQAYIQFGWAPAAFRAGGLAPDLAGFMVALIAICGIPASLLMPGIVATARRQTVQGLIIMFGVLLVVGYLGIAFLPTTLPLVWALCLGVSGFCFPTALALIIDRTDDADVTARVSGFVQPVGYILAAIGPFLVGALLPIVGSWVPILLVLATTSIPMVGAGLLAVNGPVVDKELA